MRYKYIFFWLATLLMIFVSGYFVWQNYESMKIVYASMEVMKAQMNTLVPMIDANVMVVR